MDTLTLVLIIVGVGLTCAFVYILGSYVKGLRGSPRELWLLYAAKIVEYSSYGAANMALTLYLSKDCGLSDIAAGSYIGVWSMLLTVATMLVGAVVDAIGIRRTLVIGAVFLLVARFFMPLLDDIYAVSLLGFVPLALGTAFMGPVMSVGIKKYTTKEGTTLGFGLLYTLFNVGWAVGYILFDVIRGHFGEHEIVAVPGVGIEMSTYQIIFAVGFLFTVPTFLLFLVMRDGVERKDDGTVVVEPPRQRAEGGTLSATVQASTEAGEKTLRIIREVFVQKAFWYYIFMIGLLVWVRLTFYHFHYTFPKYGIRVLGEGVKIGNIYGALNPILIVFLVPFVAALTKKVSSFRMMIIGTTISSLAIFLATIPAEVFTPWIDSWFGELVYVRWLDVPVEGRTPVFISLIVAIIIFTIGEALWSPRLMQFTAEVAPEGKEGSYIALSYLPFFAAKLIAGPLSGWLVATYTPEGAEAYPHHIMVWVWIGGMALISPIGLRWGSWCSGGCCLRRSRGRCGCGGGSNPRPSPTPEPTRRSGPPPSRAGLPDPGHRTRLRRGRRSAGDRPHLRRGRGRGREPGRGRGRRTGRRGGGGRDSSRRRAAPHRRLRELWRH